MKKQFLPILLLTLIFSACSKEDLSCDVTNIEETILGTWTESKVNDVGDMVTFFSDKRATCTSNSVFYTELNGIPGTNFTWEISADNVLLADYDNGLGFEYPIKSVKCDNIKLEFFIFEIELKK